MFEVSKQTNAMNKQSLLQRIGSKLNESFNIERARPEKDFRADAEYNTAIFNALGDSMEDVDTLLWG